MAIKTERVIDTAIFLLEIYYGIALLATFSNFLLIMQYTQTPDHTVHISDHYSNYFALNRISMICNAIC